MNSNKEGKFESKKNIYQPIENLEENVTESRKHGIHLGNQNKNEIIVVDVYLKFQKIMIKVAGHWAQGMEK